MLNKKYRLTKRKQFNYIYRKGRTVSSDALSLVFSYSRMQNIKIGFSASKKIGSSVVRHRVLRVMREAVGPLIAKMAQNQNYIFIARDGICQKCLIDVRKNMEFLLRKAGLFRDSE